MFEQTKKKLLQDFARKSSIKIENTMRSADKTSEADLMKEANEQTQALLDYYNNVQFLNDLEKEIVANSNIVVDTKDLGKQIADQFSKAIEIKL